ncbi:hypothetical protein BC826DRAFT_1106268 [Russula brevipes]|nr:hypothetical protein BC826DRAFT_1106268 [Russula brevipes]
MDHKATVHRRVTYIATVKPVLSSRMTTIPSFLSYVRDVIFPSTSVSSSLPTTHPVDAYCGAGLFVLTSASHFKQLARTGLFADLIRFTTHNIFSLDFPPARVRIALVIDRRNVHTQAEDVEQIVLVC